MEGESRVTVTIGSLREETCGQGSEREGLRVGMTKAAGMTSERQDEAE